MTKHSTLTNADDLHYAKIRSFTGDSVAITPDFVDQILTATDTNKIYRATGINQGDLVEFSASSGSNQQALITGNYYPSISPSFIGQFYFDLSTAVLYFAKGLSSSDWRTVAGNTEIQLTIQDAIGVGSMTFDLYFSQSYPEDGFDFTEIAITGIGAGNTIDASIIDRLGTGYYAIAPSLSNPDPTIAVRCSLLNAITQSVDNRTLFVVEYLPGTVTAQNQPISSDILWFREFPKERNLGRNQSGDPYFLSFEIENF